MNHPRRPGPTAGATAPAMALPTGGPSARPDVHIAIDKLSLHGFTEGQQQRFVQVLSSTLSRMAAEKQDWSSLSSLRLDAIPALQARSGDMPEASAIRLARELFDRLDSGKRERRHG